MQKKKKMFIPCARKRETIDITVRERERERHIEREKGSGLFL
jgi:hypothetical protein